MTSEEIAEEIFNDAFEYAEKQRHGNNLILSPSFKSIWAEMIERNQSAATSQIIKLLEGMVKVQQVNLAKYDKQIDFELCFRSKIKALQSAITKIKEEKK